jgi:hypothetical protein
MPGQLKLMADVMELGLHCGGTHWFRGFMAIRQARRIRTVVLMTPV